MDFLTLSSTVDLAGYRRLWINKDIGARVDGEAVATISGVQQTFSQSGGGVVPDRGTTMALLGLALSGVGGLRRKVGK